MGSCGSCAYWVGIVDEVVEPDGTAHAVYSAIEGSCRRYPPVAVPAGTPAPGERPRFAFPLTVLSGWCGEWRSCDPGSFDEVASALARSTLAGDLTAARALADQLRE